MKMVKTTREEEKEGQEKEDRGLGVAKRRRRRAQRESDEELLSLQRAEEKEKDSGSTTDLAGEEEGEKNGDLNVEERLLLLLSCVDFPTSSSSSAKVSNNVSNRGGENEEERKDKPREETIRARGDVVRELLLSSSSSSSASGEEAREEEEENFSSLLLEDLFSDRPRHREDQEGREEERKKKKKKKECHNKETEDSSCNHISSSSSSSSSSFSSPVSFPSSSSSMFAVSEEERKTIRGEGDGRRREQGVNALDELWSLETSCPSSFSQHPEEGETPSITTRQSKRQEVDKGRESRETLASLPSSCSVGTPRHGSSSSCSLRDQKIESLLPSYREGRGTSLSSTTCSSSFSSFSLSSSSSCRPFLSSPSSSSSPSIRRGRDLGGTTRRSEGEGRGDDLGRNGEKEDEEERRGDTSHHSLILSAGFSRDSPPYRFGVDSTASSSANEHSPGKDEEKKKKKAGTAERSSSALLDQWLGSHRKGEGETTGRDLRCYPSSSSPSLQLLQYNPVGSPVAPQDNTEVRRSYREEEEQGERRERKGVQREDSLSSLFTRPSQSYLLHPSSSSPQRRSPPGESTRGEQGTHLPNSSHSVDLPHHLPFSSRSCSSSSFASSSSSSAASPAIRLVFDYCNGGVYNEEEENLLLSSSSRPFLDSSEVDEEDGLGERRGEEEEEKWLEKNGEEDLSSLLQSLLSSSSKQADTISSSPPSNLLHRHTNVSHTQHTSSIDTLRRNDRRKNSNNDHLSSSSSFSSSSSSSRFPDLESSSVDVGVFHPDRDRRVCPSYSSHDNDLSPPLPHPPSFSSSVDSSLRGTSGIVRNSSFSSSFSFLTSQGGERCRSRDPVRQRQRREMKEKSFFGSVQEIANRFKSCRSADVLRLVKRYFACSRRKVWNLDTLELIVAACSYISSRQSYEGLSLSDISGELVDQQKMSLVSSSIKRPRRSSFTIQPPTRQGENEAREEVHRQIASFSSSSSSSSRSSTSTSEGGGNLVEQRSLKELLGIRKEEEEGNEEEEEEEEEKEHGGEDDQERSLLKKKRTRDSKKTGEEHEKNKSLNAISPFNGYDDILAILQPTGGGEEEEEQQERKIVSQAEKDDSDDTSKSEKRKESGKNTSVTTSKRGDRGTRGEEEEDSTASSSSSRRRRRRSPKGVCRVKMTSRQARIKRLGKWVSRVCRQLHLTSLPSQDLDPEERASRLIARVRQMLISHIQQEEERKPVYLRRLLHDHQNTSTKKQKKDQKRSEKSSSSSSLGATSQGRLAPVEDERASEEERSEGGDYKREEKKKRKKKREDGSSDDVHEEDKRRWENVEEASSISNDEKEKAPCINTKKIHMKGDAEEEEENKQEMWLQERNRPLTLGLLDECIEGRAEDDLTTCPPRNNLERIGTSERIEDEDRERRDEDSRRQRIERETPAGCSSSSPRRPFSPSSSSCLVPLSLFDPVIDGTSTDRGRTREEAEHEKGGREEDVEDFLSDIFSSSSLYEEEKAKKRKRKQSSTGHGSSINGSANGPREDGFLNDDDIDLLLSQDMKDHEESFCSYTNTGVSLSFDNFDGSLFSSSLAPPFFSSSQQEEEVMKGRKTTELTRDEKLLSSSSSLSIPGAMKEMHEDLLPPPVRLQMQKFHYLQRMRREAAERLRQEKDAIVKGLVLLQKVFGIVYSHTMKKGSEEERKEEISDQQEKEEKEKETQESRVLPSGVEKKLAIECREAGDAEMKKTKSGGLKAFDEGQEGRGEEDRQVRKSRREEEEGRKMMAWSEENPLDQTWLSRGRCDSVSLASLVIIVFQWLKPYSILVRFLSLSSFSYPFSL
ncbi:ap2 domain transcription factor ap2x-3 [Cystoisospora suis]|uniref:Ap2 domain transcription factor ap2x-3 n=1 Tax=Cystoisospora suis TaxID=483139 RepID=A0A2C6L0J4_9APIC|nr:ap2 domain transcription factor ap2x-3 [Cystoisospora suis]